MSPGSSGSLSGWYSSLSSSSLLESSSPSSSMKWKNLVFFLTRPDNKKTNTFIIGYWLLLINVLTENRIIHRTSKSQLPVTYKFLPHLFSLCLLNHQSREITVMK
jgi:hypothetical protein